MWRESQGRVRTIGNLFTECLLSVRCFTYTSYTSQTLREVLITPILQVGKLRLRDAVTRPSVTWPVMGRARV